MTCQVEGDGRFVPATEEEVIHVEDFLVDDKTEMYGVPEVENTAQCISSEENAAEKVQVEGPEEGFLFATLILAYFHIYMNICSWVGCWVRGL